MMMSYEDFLYTVTLSDDSYAGLILKVEEYYRNENTDKDLNLLSSHFVSDRFSKKVYYFAVLKRGDHQINDATPFLDDEDGE